MVGVNGTVDIGLHHANAVGVLKKVDETRERGCLARARRAHDVEEKLPARLKVLSHAVCLGVIVGKDTLFELDYLDFLHALPLQWLRTQSPSPRPQP